jgi:GST-like protein
LIVISGQTLGGGDLSSVGDQMTIADLACYPWYGILVLGKIYDAAEFLNVKEYTRGLGRNDEQATGMELGRQIQQDPGPGAISCRKASAQDFKDLERVRTTKSKGQSPI